jgi:hypothetical protein
MYLFEKSNRQNVTSSLLVFGHNIEIFTHHTEDDFELKHPSRDILLSNGALETKQPLPILNALFREFFEVLNNNYDDLAPSVELNISLLHTILKNAYTSLDIDYHRAFIIPDQNEYLLDEQLNLKHFYLNPLTEILMLIQYTLRLSPGERIINTKLTNLFFSHSWFYERKYHVYKDLALEAYNKRLNQSIPRVEPVNKIFQAAFVKEDIPMPAMKAYSPISYAWFELYFAQISGMANGLCTFCGTVFTLHKKSGNALNKSTCGSKSCRNALRKQRQALKDPEEVKAKSNLRQKKHRALQYNDEGKLDVEKFAVRNKISVKVVKDWIAEEKEENERKQKDKKKNK